ncbi:MAG: hypothetical protein SVC26_02460 [Pseudomonadota bacterium]|nr:hypothetical protein [Pseudomonadota bacterium]
MNFSKATYILGYKTRLKNKPKFDLSTHEGSLASAHWLQENMVHLSRSGFWKKETATRAAAQRGAVDEIEIKHCYIDTSGKGRGWTEQVITATV